MRNGSLNDVVDGVTSFARRQPAAFLGLSVLAGFAMVRFLKASAADASSSPGSHHSTQSYGSHQQGGARRSSPVTGRPLLGRLASS